MGMTVPVDLLDSYVVVIQSKMSIKDIGLTLAHEMVHVRQMARGTLKSVNGVNYWAGKRYTKRTKYLDQPWEQDAFARQEILFRKAIDS
jgi:predicted metal-dependent phosphotriesterase family hydrolase